MTPEPNTSVDQIFDTLQQLVDSGSPVGVIDLARELGIPASTAHRLLATVQDVGFAVRDSTGAKYEVGVRAHTLVHGVFRQFGLQREAGPHISSLAAEFGETTALEVPIGWHSVRIAAIEGSNEIHAATRLGEATPLASCAGGLAMLAHMPTPGVESYLRWEGGGHRSPARTRALRARLASVVEHGRAREGQPGGGYAEVAFPVRLAGRAVATVCIDGTTSIVGEAPRASELARASKIVDRLERAVNARPELAHDPFGHLAADQVAKILTAH